MRVKKAVRFTVSITYLALAVNNALENNQIIYN